MNHYVVFQATPVKYQQPKNKLQSCSCPTIINETENFCMHKTLCSKMMHDGIACLHTAFLRAREANSCQFSNEKETDRFD